MSLRLVLTPEKPRLAPGAPLAFKAALRNEGERPLRICTYMLHHRLLGGMSAVDAEGYEYGLFPFEPQRWMKFRTEDVRELGVKRSLVDRIALDKETGWGFLRTGSMPAVVPRSHVIGRFPRGAVRFSTLLVDRVSLYVGRAGTYDFSWKRRRIPEDVPGAAAVDFSSVAMAMIEAEAVVTFE